MHIWHTFNLHFLLYVDIVNARRSWKIVVLSITRKALYIIILIIIIIPCYITLSTLMFGRSKVKANSESEPSKFIHLFFGPLLAFPLPVIIIIAQLIIGIKVKDIKLEFICYSVEYFLKIIVMTFQNYENVHFYYFFFSCWHRLGFRRPLGKQGVFAQVVPII